MASFILFSLLLTLSAAATPAVEINFTTFNVAPTTSPVPPPLPSLSVHPQPQPPPTHHQDSPQQLQFNSIIDSIVGAGDFSNWANLLAQADPSLFPVTATFFIPDDAAFITGNGSSPANVIDPLLFPYHIVPRRFTFSELRQFPIGARLPTLLPRKTLLITNNSAVNYTVNGGPLTRPDLFQSSAVSVHGIKCILDYNLFGDDASSPETTPEFFSSPGSFPNPENSANSVPSPELRQKQRGPVIEYPRSAAAERAFILFLGILMLPFVLQDTMTLLFDSLIGMLITVSDFLARFFNVK